MSRPIRVCIVENEALVRQGLRALLELDPAFEVCGEARDGAEALRLIPGLRPDVVLLDLRMPDVNGLEVLRALNRDEAQGTPPPCLVLTTFDDPELALDAIRAGARGYLLKDASFEQLAHAIRALAAGESALQPAITDRLARSLASLRSAAPAPPLDPHDPLTERELEVLRLMAGGYSNREISSALQTAEGTIKNHVSSILGKLYVRDRTRAVLKALESGLL